jgi:hypothetical protein
MMTNNATATINEVLFERIKDFPTPWEISDELGYEDFDQNNPHHFGTLNEHVNMVMHALPEDSNDCLIMAASLHDLGKFETAKVNEKTGYLSFIGHAAKSVEIMERNDLLPDDPRAAEYVKELVRLHDTKYSKQGKCQELLDSHHFTFAGDLLTLQYADILGQSDYELENKLIEVKNFGERLLKLATPEQADGIKKALDLITSLLD